MLPLHECVVEPLQDVVDSATAESAAEPLHAIADPAAIGAALTKTSCLCV
jgi:hypothetical protein